MRTTHLPIAEPCHEDWDAMDRADRGRFCHACVKTVYDLSSMTERDARDVLAREAGASICIRYLHDDQGRVRFASPDPPPRPRATPGRVARAGAAMMAAAMAACTPHADPPAPTPEPEVRTEALMGGFLGTPTPKPGAEPEVDHADEAGDATPPTDEQTATILDVMEDQQPMMGLVSPYGIAPARTRTSTESSLGPAPKSTESVLAEIGVDSPMIVSDIVQVSPDSYSGYRYRP